MACAEGPVYVIALGPKYRAIKLACLAASIALSPFNWKGSAKKTGPFQQRRIARWDSAKAREFLSARTFTMAPGSGMRNEESSCLLLQKDANEVTAGFKKAQIELVCGSFSQDAVMLNC